jgi:hypothetical protein
MDNLISSERVPRLELSFYPVQEPSGPVGIMEGHIAHRTTPEMHAPARNVSIRGVAIVAINLLCSSVQSNRWTLPKTASELLKEGFCERYFLVRLAHSIRVCHF